MSEALGVRVTVAFEVETAAETTTLFARSMTELAVTVAGSSEAEKTKVTFVVTGTLTAFAVGFTDETESGVGAGGGGGGVEPPPPPPQAKSTDRSPLKRKSFLLFLMVSSLRKVRKRVGEKLPNVIARVVQLTTY